MELASLLIEGGMRGFFSSGVLQCLLDHHSEIPYVIGITSASLNAMGYVTGNLQCFFRCARSGSDHFLQLGNLNHPDRGTTAFVDSNSITRNSRLPMRTDIRLQGK